MNKIINIIKAWPWWVLGGFVAAGIIAIGLLAEQIGGAANIAVFSTLVNLALIVPAVAVLFISLRLADKIGGITWKAKADEYPPGLFDMIKSAKYGAVAYACTRWIAIAIIISAVMR